MTIEMKQAIENIAKIAKAIEKNEKNAYTDNNSYIAGENELTDLYFALINQANEISRLTKIAKEIQEDFGYCGTARNITTILAELK